MTESTITLSPEQDAAKAAILAWWGEARKAGRSTFKLAGYAGTGKTTLLGDILAAIKTKDKASVAFCTITGKASTILRAKLSLGDEDFCGTIHSLIYRPILGSGGALKGWVRAGELGGEHGLIVVDEASMVNEDIYHDLQKFNLPILAVGDQGQLPPVTGDFNLMSKPDFKLETIHRQAEDNPIIRLSMTARKYGSVDDGTYGQGVRKISVPNLARAIHDNFDPAAMYLCAFNSTRTFVNKLYREYLKIKSPIPIKGERVICLKNNRKEGIFNGMTGVLRSISKGGKDTYSVEIEMDGGERFAGKISRFQFGQPTTPQNWNVTTHGNLFDYGYCLTVHKAQGSESRKVILIEQRSSNTEDFLYAKWLYTGITRSKEELLIIKVRG